MTNAHNTVLYAGVTNDLQHSIEHKEDQSGFTKYNLTKLVYFEYGDDIKFCYPARETNQETGSRQKKIDLVNKAL